VKLELEWLALALIGLQLAACHQDLTGWGLNILAEAAGTAAGSGHLLGSPSFSPQRLSPAPVSASLSASPQGPYDADPLPTLLWTLLPAPPPPNQGPSTGPSTGTGGTPIRHTGAPSSTPLRSGGPPPFPMVEPFLGEVAGGDGYGGGNGSGHRGDDDDDDGFVDDSDDDNVCEDHAGPAPFPMMEPFGEPSTSAGLGELGVGGLGLGGARHNTAPRSPRRHANHQKRDRGRSDLSVVSGESVSRHGAHSAGTLSVPSSVMTPHTL